MKKLLLQFAALLVAICCSIPVFAQVTTASISGTVVDDTKTSMPGATIIATHTPTGSVFGTTTREDGRFNLPNINVGGPYTIKITFVGFQDIQKENIYLSINQNLSLNVEMIPSSKTLGEVEIVAGNQYINSDKKGTETVITEEKIASMPTVSRSIFDITRLTPQATITADNGLSLAGMNNRYNSIFIDGAVNNDVFGLAANGTNGGQTGVNPISLDAIEEFQVVLAPYDVRLGGFAGGGINAVTRSGTNTTTGSVYYFFRNQGLAGKTPTDIDTLTRTRLADFTAQTVGARVGGALKKDKIFYFINLEYQSEQTPQPNAFENYTGDATRSDIDALVSKLKEYGYDPGTYESNTKEFTSNRFIAKIDWNINKNNKLSVRHSYTLGHSITPANSNNNTVMFSNAGIDFPSVTNSSALELNTRIGNNKSNNLIVGYTNVVDNRGQIGDPFPYVSIKNGTGSIQFGSEQFSTANLLTQNILTLTDNFNIYKGKHSLTIGTHNEFYDLNNVFIRQNFGSYLYDSLSQFMNDIPARQYDRSYSLLDDVTGDDTKAAAAFKSLQLGFYVQDKFEITNRFNLTGGVRVDIPMFLTSSITNAAFNDTTLARINAAGYNLEGAKTGVMPSPQVMISPRIGFNWNMKGDQSAILRGGVGVFTSRIPFVWPGGAYNNNGLTVGGTRKYDVAFNSDPYAQPFAPDLTGTVKPSGEINLFAKNFKYPQIFRTNLGLDYKLPVWGLVATADVMFTKTLNNIFYQNVNLKASEANLTNGPDTRPIYNYRSAVDPSYTYIIYGSNTNKGYGYNATFQISKPSAKGFGGSVAYTLGHSYSVYEGTSSQNSSQWRGVNALNGRNNAELGVSDFDMGSRIVASLAYKVNYAKHAATTVSFFFNGQSGNPYSYIYSDNGALTSEDSRARNLIWIPKDASEINLVDKTVNGVTYTKEQQWQYLEDFIKNDPYLSKHQGEYAERNGARAPFKSSLDFRLLQDFYIKTEKGTKHNLQISLDVFNVLNMVNKNWGRIYYVPFGQSELINFEGFEADKTTPKFSFTKNADGNYKPTSINDSGIGGSRWQAQLGVRYSF